MMRKTAWIWFAGFLAWLADALISLRMHNMLHARLALMVAIVFFTAGLFYRRQTWYFQLISAPAGAVFAIRSIICGRYIVL